MAHNPTSPPAALGWRARAGAVAVPLAMLAVIVAAVAASGPLRGLLDGAWARLGLAPVLAVLPVQAAAIWLCSVAMWALRPGVSAAACFESRILRDAGNNMLLVLPGLGEAVGTRAMVLAGASPRGAMMVRALDILAETLGQLPYMVVAFVVLAHVWGRIGLPGAARPGDLAIALALVIACLIIAAAAWLRGPGRATPIARRVRIEGHLLAREARRRRRGLPVAVLLHILAWGLSGVQIWLAGRLMGLPLTLGHGIAIESAASTARVVLFFVPGGLVTQEAGVIAAGLLFGIAPVSSLALALVLRLRDLAFGLALGWWPVIEVRARRARG